MNATVMKNEYARAQKMRAQGDKINAARLFLAVQKWATTARHSKMKDFLIDYSHASATNVAISIMGDSNSSHADRSEAGRIKAESYRMFAAC